MRRFAGIYTPIVTPALELLGFAAGSPRPPLRPVGAQAVEVMRSQMEALGMTCGADPVGSARRAREARLSI